MRRVNRYDAADRVARASLRLAQCLAEYADLHEPPTSRDDYCVGPWDEWGETLAAYERATSPARSATNGEGGS